MIQVANNVTSKTVGNTTSGISLTFDSNGVITSAANVTLSVANTQLTGTITATQLAANSVNSTIIAANTISNTNIQTGAIENYFVTNNFMSGFRNRIINGNFLISQRGSTFNSMASGQYGIDRWQISYRPGTVNMELINNTTYYAMRLTNGDGSAQSFDCEQRIEETRQFHNSTGSTNYVLSFYAKASTTSSLGTNVYANYGSGGSSQDTILETTVSVTTTRKRFVVFLTFPDMSSKSIGVNNYVRVLFSPTNLAASAWIEIDSVQLETGTVATPFEYRLVPVELALCQRYFQFLPMSVGAAASSTQARGHGAHFGEMRTAPTVAATGVLSITDSYSADFIQSSAAANVINNDTRCSFFDLPNFTGLTGGRLYFFPRFQNSNKVSLSAEL